MYPQRFIVFIGIHYVSKVRHDAGFVQAATLNIRRRSINIDNTISLSKNPGSSAFKNLKSVSGVVKKTYQATGWQKGLLEN